MQCHIMGTGRLLASRVASVPSAQCLNLIDQAQVTLGLALNLILFNQLSLINSLPPSLDDKSNGRRNGTCWR